MKFLKILLLPCLIGVHALMGLSEEVKIEINRFLKNPSNLATAERYLGIVEADLPRAKRKADLKSLQKRLNETIATLRARLPQARPAVPPRAPAPQAPLPPAPAAQPAPVVLPHRPPAIPLPPAPAPRPIAPVVQPVVPPQAPQPAPAPRPGAPAAPAVPPRPPAPQAPLPQFPPAAQPAAPAPGTDQGLVPPPPPPPMPQAPERPGTPPNVAWRPEARPGAAEHRAAIAAGVPLRHVEEPTPEERQRDLEERQRLDEAQRIQEAPVGQALAQHGQQIQAAREREERRQAALAEVGAGAAKEEWGD